MTFPFYLYPRIVVKANGTDCEPWLCSLRFLFYRLLIAYKKIPWRWGVRLTYNFYWLRNMCIVLCDHIKYTIINLLSTQNESQGRARKWLRTKEDYSRCWSSHYHIILEQCCCCCCFCCLFLFFFLSSFYSEPARFVPLFQSNALARE